MKLKNILQKKETILKQELDNKELMFMQLTKKEKEWDEYQEKKLQQQIAERKFNTLKSATGLITMLAIVLNLIHKSDTLYIVLYVIAILISLAFTIKAYVESSKLPQEMQALTDKFQQEYQCPKCHHFLGSQSYDLLRQNKNCPYCKVNFDFN